MQHVQEEVGGCDLPDMWPNTKILTILDQQIYKMLGYGLELWYLMPLSIILQLYRGDQFDWWRKLEYPEETTDLPKVADKLYQIML